MSLLDSYFKELKDGKISLSKKETFFNGAFTEKRDVVIPLSDVWVEGYKRALLDEIEKDKPIFASSLPLNEDDGIVLLPQNVDATYSDMARLNNGDVFVSSLDEELVKFTNNFNSMVRYGYYDAGMTTDESYSKVVNVALNPSETQIALTMGDTIQKIKIYSLPTFEFVREIVDTDPLVGVAYRTDDELYYATDNKVIYDYVDTTTSSRAKVPVLEFGLNGFPSNLGVENVKKIRVYANDLWVSDSRDRLSVFTHVLDVTNGHTVSFTGVTYNLLSKLFLDGNADILDFNIDENSEFLYLLCEQDRKLYKVNLTTHEIVDSFGSISFLNYADSLSTIKQNVWQSPISFYVEGNNVTLLDVGANSFLRGVLTNVKTFEYELTVPFDDVIDFSDEVLVDANNDKTVTLEVPLDSEQKKLCYYYKNTAQTTQNICEQ